MSNKDLIQSHQDPSEPVLIQPLENTNLNQFPNSPQPTHIQPHAQPTTYSYKQRRTRKSLFTIAFLPPPQNRLAFISAVKTAWSLHRRTHHPKPLKQQKATPLKLLPPPITADSLLELSIPHLFKSLQIRHDLLIDPNLTFRPNLTPQKRTEADRYWQRIRSIREGDPQGLLMIRQLVAELGRILASLVAPFPPTLQGKQALSWDWPSQINERMVLDVLDPDLIHQQLMKGCLGLDEKFGFLYSILSPLSPDQADKIKACFEQQDYSKALEYTFLTLEALKLDCANKTLQFYRPYLIETGIHLEWKVFLQQLDHGDIQLTSVSNWLLSNWKKLGPEAKFIQVYRTGLINLVTDDLDSNPGGEPFEFPVTFCYDERRLRRQMRHEFQNIIVLGLLLMPYRVLADKKAKLTDLIQLKQTFSKLLKNASTHRNHVSCFHLALHACNTANRVVQFPYDPLQQAQYWSDWMNHNLVNTSSIYQIMYHRVRGILLKGMTQGKMDENQHHATLGLDQEIDKLGKKLILISDYNLRTYGPIYTYLLPSIKIKLSQ